MVKLGGCNILALALFNIPSPWERQTPVAQPGPIKMLITNTSKEGGEYFLQHSLSIFSKIHFKFCNRCRRKSAMYDLVCLAGQM